jgi:hypothetical protein
MVQVGVTIEGSWVDARAAFIVAFRSAKGDYQPASMFLAKRPV